MAAEQKAKTENAGAEKKPKTEKPVGEKKTEIIKQASVQAETKEAKKIGSQKSIVEGGEKENKVQKTVAGKKAMADKKIAEKKAESVKKAETAKKKFIPYIKKENKVKSKEAREKQKKLKGKKHLPVFRGRFGKKNIRRKSIAKWDKWRKPHGIDLDKGLQHGFRPKIGYKASIETRFLHPSGYQEAMVCNFNDLAKINPKMQAARISRTLGKRKRNEIIKRANEKGIWVLN